VEYTFGIRKAGLHSFRFSQKFILFFVFEHIYVTRCKTVDGATFFDLTLTTGNIYFQEILSFRQ